MATRSVKKEKAQFDPEMTYNADPWMQDFAEVGDGVDEAIPPAELGKWEDSPFRWIKLRGNKKIGMCAVRWIQEWCDHKEIKVTATDGGDQEADLLVGNARVEVCISTTNAIDGGRWAFQNLKPKHKFDYVLCLGLRPKDLRCWLVPKEVILKYAKGQQGGKKETLTKVLDVAPENPPYWMREHGGFLKQVTAMLKILEAGGHV